MKTLNLDYPLDKHLKPVKDSDGNNSSLEISTEKVRVKDIDSSGELNTQTLTASGLSYPTSDGNEADVIVTDGEGTLSFGNPERLYFQVRNDEGSTISAGSPLYSKGEIGGSNRILVGVCDADDSSKMPCIGIAVEEMNTSSTQDNFCIANGVYNTNISGFTGLSVGDNLYVSDSGGLTQTRPSNTDDLIQNVGIVLKTNGTICQGLLVSAIGRTNDVPNLLTNTLHLDDDVKLEFGDADEYIKGDGTNLIISSTSNVSFNGSRIIGASRFTFNDGGSTVDIVRDEDDMTSNDANALVTQQSVKSYVDTNRRWSIETGGYRSNNNSSSIYYFQYRPNGEVWSNTDSSIASISVYDSYASMLVAPYDGKVTKISVHGYANDTGAADPLKFYVFKGTPSSGATNLSLTQIGVTGTINPVAARQFVENTDISSSNTFSQHDAIFVMYKKDSTTANQDLYFSITVSGEYTS